MITKILKTITVTASILIAGGFVAANSQTVSGSIANGEVTRGKAARVTVVLEIPSGLHANSNRPGSEYAIPTTVKATANGVRIGAVRYPAGHNRKFAFSEDKLNVYERKVSFGFDITVPKTSRASTVSVAVTVRYQACTVEVCYPPKSKPITLTARVR